FRGEHHGIEVSSFRTQGPDLAAKLDAVETGEHPIEQDQTRRFRLLEQLPCLVAVRDSQKIKAPLLQVARDLMSVDNGVLNQQYAHVFSPIPAPLEERAA